MDLLRWLLFGVLPAIAVVLLGVGVGGPRWLALSLAAAICVPFAIVIDWPDWFWQLDLLHGDPRPALWWVLLFTGVIGSLYDLRWLPRWLAVGIEGLLVFALPWFLSGPMRARASFEVALIYLLAGWFVIALTWWVLRRAARAQSGFAVPLAMAMVFGVDAWLLRRHTGGADWQLAGVAAVTLVLAMLTVTFRRSFTCGSGAALCMALAHSGLLLCGRSEREVLQWPFAIAWLAPLPLWLCVCGFARRWRRTGACVGVLAVAGACALALVVG